MYFEREVIRHDYETYGVVDLNRTGSDFYARDSRTGAECLAWIYGEDGEHHFWHQGHDGDLWRRVPDKAGKIVAVRAPEIVIPASETPVELLERIGGGAPMEAHNAHFEMATWNRTIPRCLPEWEEIIRSRNGRPTSQTMLPIEQFHCTMALCSAHGLPRGLGSACDLLGLENRKNDEGYKAMMRFCKPDPRETKKAEGEPVFVWDVSDVEKLWEYCPDDVYAQRGISRRLHRLSEGNRKVWFINRQLNEQGVKIDKEGVEAAIKLAEMTQAKLRKEFEGLTHETPDLKKPTQDKKFKEWLASQGVTMPNLQRKTVEAAVAQKVALERGAKRAHRALDIRLEFARATVKKYYRMIERLAEDDRCRDILLWNGAHTGRWTGAGPQFHNLFRDGWKQMQTAWEVMKEVDPDTVELMYGDVMGFLARCVRGAIVSEEGHKLYIADYEQIELRITFWLSGHHSANQVLVDGGDLYCDMATDVYGFEVIKGQHGEERQIGKETVLGSGFGLGWQAFTANCLEKWGVRVSDNLAQSAIKTYRSKYWGVPMCWTGVARAHDQNTWDGCETAAIKAMKTPGKWFKACRGLVHYMHAGRFLFCRLPSGRMLHYYNPALEIKEKFGKLKEQLTFQSATGKRRETTWGGTLFENVVQAIAYDILAIAIIRCYNAGLLPVLTVHDELVCEISDALGITKEAYEAICARPIRWAKGLPVRAPANVATRYQKFD